MKKQNYFKTIFLLLLFSININAQVPPYVPTNGLVGWWPFNGNAIEFNTSATPSTNSASLTADRFLNANCAYSFNGTSMIKYLGSNPLSTIGNSTQNWTFNFWVKASNSSGGKILGSFGWGYSMNLTNTNNLRFDFINSSLNWSTYTSLSSLSINNWHLVTVTRSNGTIQMFIDNIPDNTFASTPNINAYGQSNSWFGANGQDNNGFFIGTIDDIGIWNRALNQAEVTALYNAVSCVAPIASITTQGNSTFCAGGSCTLNANAGNSYTYQWYNNGTLINGATAITFTASQAGNYTVKVTDGLTSCFTTSQPQSVIVNPQPNVSFGFLASFVCIRTAPINLLGSPNGGTYQGPGISGSAFSPTVAGLGNKNLKYTYTDNNGCSNFANQSVIIYDTIICPTVSGIIKNSEDLLNEESVKIYPNPNQGFFNLELLEFKNTIIRVTDVLGKTILNQKAELFNEIDLKNQSSGVYTINIITDKKVKYSTKVIKE